MREENGKKKAKVDLIGSGIAVATAAPAAQTKSSGSGIAGPVPAIMDAIVACVKAPGNKKATAKPDPTGLGIAATGGEVEEPPANKAKKTSLVSKVDPPIANV